MAMKKADMEAHQIEYRSHMKAAEVAESQGLYRAAIDHAISAWEHIDGMMQYERKYEDVEHDSIPAIDFVLRYAPLLLDYRVLDRLDALLSEYKRIERNTAADMGEKLRRSRTYMSANHRLWNYIEAHPGIEADNLREAIGGEHKYWDYVLQAWQKMGLLTCVNEGTSRRLALSTRMGEVVPGKCPRCGEVQNAPKGMMLEETACPSCRSRVLFVILCSNSTGKSRE